MMTDVHEAYVERRRWRIWPILVLILVALFAIGMLVAMIMNIHGSVTWPAGEVKFGFWPKTESIAIAPAPKVANEIAPSLPAPAPPIGQVQGGAQVEQVQGAAPAIQNAQPATPPAESNTAPDESAPP